MRPVLCLITDRRRFGSAWRDALQTQVRAASAAGVQLVQVREGDLDSMTLLSLVRECLEAVRGTATRVLVNDRVDVALAAGAHGVHLRSDSVPARAVRALTGRPFLLGRSVHSLDEAVSVDTLGDVDYLLFGTVFETASKPGQRAAGVSALGDVAARTRVPVLAVGGITPDRLGSIAAAGAAGAAAIGLFASVSATGMASLVEKSCFEFDRVGALP